MDFAIDICRAVAVVTLRDANKMKYVSLAAAHDRNLGDGSPLKSPRSLNALWTKAGILYVPPIR